MAKSPAWTRSEGKNPEGGLNEKGRASLRAAGHDIKRPQPEGGSRKDSFCARMKGMKAKLTSSETANDPDSRINKSLRKWKCADGGALDIARQYKAGGGEIYLLKQKLAEMREESRKEKNLKTRTPPSKSLTTPYGTSPTTPNISKDLYEKGNLGEDNYALAKGGAAKAASRIARKYRALGGSSTELVEGQNPAVAAANPVPVNVGAQSVPAAQPAAVSPAYMPPQAMATSAPASGPSNDVNNLFKTYLGRDADIGGLEYYSGLLNSGAMTLKDITNDITNSPEGRNYASSQPQYSLHNYGGYSDQYANATNNPEQTVKTIFKDVLGRDVDEGGLKYYSDMIRQGVSPSDIYNDVSGSEEAYANEAIKGYFQDILGRDPDQGGLDYYKRQLLSGRPPEEIKNEFMGSKEANSYNNMAFIKDEYAGLLGREPTQEELSKALNDLSSGKVTYEDFDNNLSNSEASQLYQASNFEPYDVASLKGAAPPKQLRTALQYAKSVPKTSEELNNIFAPIEQKYGRPPGSLLGMMGIESTWGQNAKAYKTNATFKGPFQLSKTIIDTYKVKNPFDWKEAAEAAAQYERDNAIEFKQKTGRDPLPHEGYPMHNQGVSGYSALAKHPNMKAVDALKTIKVASSHIRDNMPPSLQGKVSYKDITAQQFMDGWKVEFDKNLAGPDNKGQTPVVAGDRGTTPKEDPALAKPFQPGSQPLGDEISQQEFLQSQGIGGDLVAPGTTMFPISGIGGGGYQDPGVFGGNYTDATSGAIAPSVPHTVTHHPVTHTPVIHTGGSHTSSGGHGSFDVGYAPDVGSYGGHHASGHGAVDPYFGHHGVGGHHVTITNPHNDYAKDGAWWELGYNKGGRINKDTGGAVESALDVARAYKKGGPVWNKPRPKSLGKPTPLSSDQKSSAKAMAKAAGRPYPNLVDNLRAAKKD